MIRFLDFPRVQFAIALNVLLTTLLVLRRLPRPLIEGCGLEDCPTEAPLSVMMADVQRRNEHAEEFLKMASAADVDVQLVLKTGFQPAPRKHILAAHLR